MPTLNDGRYNCLGQPIISYTLMQGLDGGHIPCYGDGRLRRISSSSIRSEERRVGKECKARGGPQHEAITVTAYPGRQTRAWGALLVTAGGGHEQRRLTVLELS